MFLDSLYAYLPYLFLVLGLAIIGLSIFWTSNNHLKQTGIEVEGIIFKQEHETSFFRSDDGYASAPNLITVRFITLQQEWITEKIKQDFRLFYRGQYRDGDKVKVFYEKDNPKNFYVDSKQSELIGRLLFSFVGFLILIYGIYQLFFVETQV